MSTGNIKKEKDKDRRRAAKESGCAPLTLAPRGKTVHFKDRLEERAPFTECPFSQNDINDLIRRRKASIRRAKGNLKSVIFSREGKTFEIRVRMHGKKVQKIVTGWRL